MKKLSILFVCFLCINGIGCSTKTNDTNTTIDTLAASKVVASVNAEIRSGDSIRNKNLAGTKQKEIPVGKESFDKIVAYIWKNGYSIRGGQHNELPGREYVFHDSDGNRHGMLAIKDVSGVIDDVVIYGYKKGIMDQDHFFPYIINTEKVYTDIPDIDGSWKDAAIVKAGYEQFLRKINKTK